MVGRLGAQPRLDGPAGPLRQQAAGSGDLLGRQTLQGVLQLAGGQQAGEPVDDLLGRTPAAWGPSVLCLSGVDLLVGR
jgi:hypothetical protein